MSKEQIHQSETVLEDELEIKLDDLSPPIPPDGGWSWVILIGSVACMFFVDGLSFSFGIMLSELQSSFEASTQEISLAGSLIVGSTLISGPIVSAMTNQFSSRSLVIGGGLASSLSLFCCCFIYNLYAFIVMFGVITGIGFGFIYLPAATVVSQWFHKHRATATGISMCGSSIGTTLYSLFLPKLFQAYTWRGGLAILAAMSLNCVAAGALFIPLRAYQKVHPIANKVTDLKKSSDHKLKENNGKFPAKIADRIPCSNSGSVAESGYLKPCMFEDGDSWGSNHSKERGDKLSHHISKAPSAAIDKIFETSDTIVEEEENPDVSTRLLESSTVAPLTDKMRAVDITTSQLASVNSINSLECSKRDKKDVPTNRPLLGLDTVARVIDEVLSSKEKDLGSGYESLTRGHYRPPHRHRTVSARQHSVEPTLGATLYVRKDETGEDVLFASAVSLRPNLDHGLKMDRETRDEIVKKLEREVDRPIHKMDLFYSGSIFQLDQNPSCTDIDTYVRQVTKTTNEKGNENYILMMLRELFDFSLFRSPTFILIITSSVFGLIGYPVPYVFLKENAQNLGYSSESSSHLLVYMCAVNTFGRVLAGVLSDRPCTDALFVNNAALIVSGIACIFLPLFTSYAGHVCFAVTYGLAIAAFVSLRIILLVEMLGLNRLTNAFGFLLLFQGLAFMISPPILAGFYDLLKSFDYTFILAGCSLIFSAILCFPLRIVLRWEQRKSGKVVSKSGPRRGVTHFIRRLRDRVISCREKRKSSRSEADHAPSVRLSDKTNFNSEA